MSNDNYPAGVSDSHPYFNPSERPVTVECTSEESKVIPSFAVKEALAVIATLVEERQWTLDRHRLAVDLVAALQFKIEEIERDSDYECQWVGELELPVSEETRWDCPRCGSENTTDTLPEERDPDEAWDRRGDDD